MQKASLVIAERIESVIDLFGKVASWLTLSIVLLIVINVILRYSMSLGSVWAQELEWHLLAAMILFGVSFSLLRGDNVRVDLFYANYTPQKKYIVDLVSAILTIIIAVFFCKTLHQLCWAILLHRRKVSRPWWHSHAMASEVINTDWLLAVGLAGFCRDVAGHHEPPQCRG